MAVEYDLVIIGNSPEGRYAALKATQLNARVALVDQSISEVEHNYSLSIYSRILSSQANLAKITANNSFHPSCPTHIWMQEVIDTLQARYSPQKLASLGVDFISGKGEFCRLPKQAFLVNNRRLRSRSYLLATGNHITVPNISGLKEVGYLTPADLWQRYRFEEVGHIKETKSPFSNGNPEILPDNLVLIGSNPLAIELAQSLARLGKEITLIVEDEKLLPAEDAEIAMLIQAQLEAEGINFLTHSQVRQIKKIEEKKWLQVGDLALETDEIIFVGEWQPNITDLNLEGVGVKVGKHGIVANEKLQSTNPKIYVCGALQGGYNFPHLAIYEANLILKNSLFFPVHKVNYLPIPWVIFTQPNLARVGMSEASARNRYGEEVMVIKQNFHTLTQALIEGETTGLLKLILRRNGEILGAYIFSPQAGELINTIALAINHKIKLGQLARYPCALPTWSEIIHQAALEWQNQRFRANKTWANWLETWFDWQRDWSK